MQVHPTGSAIHLALAGTLGTLVGVLVESGAVVAWSGAMLLGLGIARAMTELSVTRLRTSGYEMLWCMTERARRITRSETLELEAELRNRDARPASFAGLRAVASPELTVRVTPEAGEVPPGGRLRLTVTVTGRRVGLHAVHGLSLEVQAGPGLFEVPLTFANSFGVEVLPRVERRPRKDVSVLGRRAAEHGRSSRMSGESSELRELRQHHPGDPFRRIAWKATARRGELMVREYEREERDVVFILIDAAGELASGRAGSATLDRVLDEAASVIAHHLGRGHPTGLGIAGRRLLAWIPPRRSSNHGEKLLEALTRSVSPVHADRSGLDEADLALRVLEHMRPLVPDLAENVAPHEFDRIARRAERLLPRAPFPEADAFAETPRERLLRRYVEAFGLGSPLRVASDRAEVDAVLVEALGRLRGERRRPSLVYLFTPIPEPGTRRAVVGAALHLKSRRTDVIWASVPASTGIVDAGVAGEVLKRRAELAAWLGARELGRLGFHLERSA